MLLAPPIPELVLLVVGHRSYRVTAFTRAIRDSGRDMVVITDRASAIAKLSRGAVLTIDPGRLDSSCADIVRQVRGLERDRGARVVGVLAPDDDLAPLGARVAEALGLAGHGEAAVRTAGDKLATRRACAARAVSGPWFEAVPENEAALSRLAAEVAYPCVVKPTRMAAGVGVIRADDADALVAACARARTIAARLLGDDGAVELMVEGYLPGQEVIVEGVAIRGRFHALAVLDKPDAGQGPFFDETLLVTPSRLQPEDVAAAIGETARVCQAVGLDHGPVHAEFRVQQGRATLLEVAARSIGGQCSAVVSLASWPSLEALLLALAVGRDVTTAELEPSPGSRGVMMIPVAKAGRLSAIDGLAQARAVADVRGVSLTVPLGSDVAPAPVSGRYLGFIQAAADTPAAVERALRAAHGCLRLDIVAPTDARPV